MVSVRSPVEHGGAYQVAFEGSFVDTLSDDELRAVVAHELGHVWIFTHHPYLQTEQLANEVALRVVPRESLKRVYAKVWPHGAPSTRPFGSPSSPPDPAFARRASAKPALNRPGARTDSRKQPVRNRQSSAVRVWR
jgi:hypothetical protein